MSRQRVLLAAFAVLVSATAVFAMAVSRSDSEFTLQEAEEALEALPARIEVHKQPGSDVLVGRVRGRHDSFAFAVSLNDPPWPGVPAVLQATDGNPTGGQGFLVWVSEVERRDETAAAFGERMEIGSGMEQALCRAETGDPCGI